MLALFPSSNTLVPENGVAWVEPSKLPATILYLPGTNKIDSVWLGDIVLFPSSLFHRTLPFSGKERICIAFDINP